MICYILGILWLLMAFSLIYQNYRDRKLFKALEDSFRRAEQELKEEYKK